VVHSGHGTHYSSSYIILPRKLFFLVELVDQSGHGTHSSSSYIIFPRKLFFLVELVDQVLQDGVAFLLGIHGKSEAVHEHEPVVARV